MTFQKILGSNKEKSENCPNEESGSFPMGDCQNMFENMSDCCGGEKGKIDFSAFLEKMPCFTTKKTENKAD